LEGKKTAWLNPLHPYLRAILSARRADERRRQRRPFFNEVLLIAVYEGLG
jgi:hypothetical protein